MGDAEKKKQHKVDRLVSTVGSIDSGNLEPDLNPEVVREKGYKIGKKIGSGGFGEVYHATNDKDKKNYAVKVIRFDKVNEEWREGKLPDELKISRKLTHPNIIKFHDVIKTRRRAFLFMDLAVDNLEHKIKVYVKKRQAADLPAGGMPEKDAQVWFKQIAHAVAYMHQKGVAHRDLKPENVLEDEEGIPRLTDFGFAAFTWERLTKAPKLNDTKCGSPGYYAPEVVSGIKYDAKQADVWSLGVILFQMLTAKLPEKMFEGDSREFLNAAETKSWKYPHHLKLSRAVVDLTERLLEPKPSKRIKSIEILYHPWIPKN